MSYELRSITTDEVPAFRTAVALGFGQDYKPDGDDRFRSLMPLERTVAAFEGNVIVGTLGDFDLRLTVPGGAQVPMAGTTMVGVRATHTRRGILRSMIRAHLDSAVDRGESIAGLWASEPGIYGRFGFGLASEMHEVKIDKRHLVQPVPATDLEFAMLSPSDIPAEVAPFWSKIATTRAGFIDRAQARWHDIMNDPEANRDGASASRHIVVRRNAEVVGYLHYRQKSKWDELVAHGSVSIETLVAADLDAHLALWAYALDVDLFPNVDFWNAAVDDPLAYTVSNARAVRRLVSDALYVRILDLPAALSARSYEHDGSIVVSVDDEMAYAAGTYRVTIVNGTATVEATQDAAQVALGVRELGALYLGRACAGLYATTGHIRGGADDVAVLADIFATSRAPWCPEMF